MTDEGMFHIDLSTIGAEPLAADDPRKIGAFPLRAVLGTGGMGRVYLGIAPDGYTAVKQVLPFLANDKGFLLHFGQELDNQARLPAGVGARLLAADRTARPPWFATEYVAGVTLHDALYYNNGPLPTAVVWTLLRTLADHLSRVARLDMVHRDLKPSNVMLTDDGCRLIDFGIARAVDQSSLTTTGKVVGTPAYMSPEQATAAKAPTAAADVFSLAGVLVYAATGHPPFGNSAGTDVLYRIVHQKPDLADLRALDPRLADVIESCLAKEPGDRPSAAALAAQASAHAQTEAGASIWPAAVASVIAARRAFADGPTVVPQPEPGPDATELEGELGQPGVGRDFAQPNDKAVVSLATEPLAPPSEPSNSSIPEPSDPPVLPRGRLLRSRKAMVLLLALLLVVGTAGTLAALDKVPFVSTVKSGSTGSGNQALTGSSPHTSTGASPTSTASASAGHSSTASPTRSGTASAGTGSGAGASTTAASGGGAAATTADKTTSAPATHTTTSGSGGGSVSDPTVVSTSYAEIKNVAASVCVSGNTGMGTQSCDSSSAVAFHEVAVSGGFELVNESTGLCLLNNEANSGSAYTFSCTWNASLQTWTVGTRTSKGGLLMNSGQCLSYSSTAQGNLDMAACNSSDTKQLWYDGGAA